MGQNGNLQRQIALAPLKKKKQNNLHDQGKPCLRGSQESWEEMKLEQLDFCPLTTGMLLRKRM